MILVIGGHAQGMKEYAAEQYGNNRIILDDLNSLLKSAIEQGEDPWQNTQEYVDLHPDAVIISELIGCGIVPIDPEERNFREIVGRCQIKLAEKAEEVIRVICGIGQKIK